jgi:hypothetical protein
MAKWFTGTPHPAWTAVQWVTSGLLWSIWLIQDAANIAFNLLKLVEEGTAIGPILLGTAKSAHVVTPGITVRGLLNMTALAAVQAR